MLGLQLPEGKAILRAHRGEDFVRMLGDFLVCAAARSLLRWLHRRASAAVLLGHLSATARPVTGGVKNDFAHRKTDNKNGLRELNP